MTRPEAERRVIEWARDFLTATEARAAPYSIAGNELRKALAALDALPANPSPGSDDVERVGRAIAAADQEDYMEDCQRYDARARNAIDAVLVLPADDGWRPIESAPKDGRALLLYIPYSPEKFPPEDCADVGRWDGDDACFRFHGDDGPDDIQPTAWMPLPQARPARFREGGRG